MNWITSNLSINIIGGIISAVIILFLSFLVKHALIPWVRKLLYQGIDLSGTWISQIDDGEFHFVYTLTLSQKANTISGSGTIIKSKNNIGIYAQSFKIEGSIWEGFITLNLKSNDRKSLSIISSLLKINNRGDSLIGYWVYREYEGCDGVESESIAFYRQR